MQIKTAMSCHFTAVRMAISKKKTNTNCWPEEKGNLMHCQCEYKLVQTLQKRVWRFLKKLKTTITRPSNSISGDLSEENENTNSKTYAPPCSLQLYLQQPRYKSNLSIYQLMNEENVVYTHTHRILFSHKKRMKFCHL